MQSTEDQIIQMAREGKTIVEICRESGLDWEDVRQRLRVAGVRSWKGAKQVIGRRLNRIVRETDRSKREQLKADVNKWVDYLYQEGQQLSRRIDRARKALDN